MKKETKIRLFCFTLVLLVFAHFLYHSYYLNEPVPSTVLFLGIFSPLLLLFSIAKAQTIRNHDQFQLFSVIGILFAVILYILYFAYYFEIYHEMVFKMLFLLLAVYTVFLFWYKKLWNS